MTPWDFTRGVRSLNRMRHVVRVLTRHGFGQIVEQLKLGRFVPLWMRRKPPDEAPLEGISGLGQRLARVCTELGPTFIKLGQMLSTRPDILPPAVLDELRTLQDDVPPFDSAVARRIVVEALGRPLDDCYASFSEWPMASGSIGQVYRATLKNGRDVVVKVRRPGVENLVQLDLQILKWLAESIESMMPELRIYRPKVIVQEFEQLLAREMDYINEASVTAALGKALADQPAVRVPHVYWELTSSRVLTLEALTGRSLGAILDGKVPDEPDLDRPLIARRLMGVYLDQILEIGIFHADPHPGNILVDPPAAIALIDFGQTATITDELITQLVIIVYAAVGREVAIVVDALADMDAIGPQTNRRELERSLRFFFDKYYGLPIKRFQVPTLLNEFSDLIRRHDVNVPREMIILIKAVSMVAGVATRLDPELDILELLKPRFRRILRERVSPSRLARTVAVSGWHLLSILRQLPASAREGLRRLTAGTWELHVRHENIDRLATELDRSSNRLAFSIVIAAIIVGSSVVVSTDASLHLFNVKVQTFGVIGYLVAGLLGLALIWAIFRSGRLH